MTEPPLLWTVTDLAGQLRMSKTHIYRLVKDKHIPFVRLGTSVRFRPDEITLWLSERTVPSVKR